MLVLDDDPTGSQLSSDVGVLLRPDRAGLRDWLRGSDPGLYLVTNTRSMSAPEAVALLRAIRADVDALAGDEGQRVAYVLRGDSTLRGHVFEESAVFEEAGGVLLFVPAFPEAGRVTVGGIHYLRTSHGVVPVARTEFAQDPVFAYRSETLADWVLERGGPRPVIHVPLERLRADGPGAVAGALLAAAAGAVVIPDVETGGDAGHVTAGLLAAERAGRPVTVRCAATLAALRIGSRPRRLAAVPVPGDRLLVVCGSHTELSSRQVAGLTGRYGPPVLLGTDRLLGPGAGEEVARVAQQLAVRLDDARVAVLASERVRRAEHGGLEHGAAVMRGLTAVVTAVRDRIDACVVKGGITSADVAVAGLGGVRGRVLGQLEPGVSVWSLAVGDGKRVPYVIVPGNIGDDGTLVRCVGALVRKAAR
ncbi:MAG: four-carbon acid sugar kinase family protein [Thermoanaerobaculia bacterium]